MKRRSEYVLITTYQVVHSTGQRACLRANVDQFISLSFQSSLEKLIFADRLIQHAMLFVDKLIYCLLCILSLSLEPVFHLCDVVQQAFFLQLVYIRPKGVILRLMTQFAHNGVLALDNFVLVLDRALLIAYDMLQIDIVWNSEGTFQIVHAFAVASRRCLVAGRR